MQKRMGENRFNSPSHEDGEHLSELKKYRGLIEGQQREFDAYRKRAKEEELKRESEFQKELEAREQIFLKREKQLTSRQREFEQHLMRRQDETEQLRQHLTERESKLQQALIDLDREKESYNEESRKKLELTSKNYVVEALNTLDEKETQFHFISKIWSAIGAISLVASIGFFAYITLSTVISLPTSITWEFLAFSIFKGLIAIALLTGLAKYSFLFSSSYMQEALKNADRRHAINFGKFYLESYGAAAEWSQVKEAFEHWNITGSNAFKKTDEAMPDITALEKAVALVERASKAIPKPKLESGGA
jgi:hypothetical protein